MTGFTANYTDPNTGMVYSNAWIQIRQINYIPEGLCLVVTDLYSDENCYKTGKSPLIQNFIPNVFASDPAWTEFFSQAVMAQANHDITTQALDYLQSIFIV